MAAPVVIAGGRPPRVGREQRFVGRLGLGQKAVPVGDGFCGAKARFPRYQIDATWRIIVANNVHLTALTV